MHPPQESLDDAECDEPLWVDASFGDAVVWVFHPCVEGFAWFEGGVELEEGGEWGGCEACHSGRVGESERMRESVSRRNGKNFRWERIRAHLDE